MAHLNIRISLDFCTTVRMVRNEAMQSHNIPMSFRHKMIEKHNLHLMKKSSTSAHIFLHMVRWSPLDVSPRWGVPFVGVYLSDIPTLPLVYLPGGIPWYNKLLPWYTHPTREVFWYQVYPPTPKRNMGPGKHP